MGPACPLSFLFSLLSSYLLSPLLFLFLFLLLSRPPVRQLSWVGQAILATEGPANASVAGGVWQLEGRLSRLQWTALLDRRLVARQPRLRALRLEVRDTRSSRFPGFRFFFFLFLLFRLFPGVSFSFFLFLLSSVS